MLSYLPPRWPAAVSGWWGWDGVPPQWLKLFSWRFSLPHMQWGWMQEPVDLRYSQRQQRRACRGTYAQREAQLSRLTSRPCWQWRILTTLRYSWKPLWLTDMNRRLWGNEKRNAACAIVHNEVILAGCFACYCWHCNVIYRYISENIQQSLTCNTQHVYAQRFQLGKYQKGRHGSSWHVCIGVSYYIILYISYFVLIICLQKYDYIGRIMITY